MLTDGRTDGRTTDDGRKVITIAHPEQSSGELKRKEFAPPGNKFFPFRVDLLSDEAQNNFISCLPLKVFPFILNIF